jgi:hypothetical protein
MVPEMIEGHRYAFYVMVAAMISFMEMIQSVEAGTMISMRRDVSCPSHRAFAEFRCPAGEADGLTKRDK